MKITTTKHASNGPVTFVTHKRFAILWRKLTTTREAQGELEVMGRRKTGIDLVRDLAQLFKAPSAQLLFESGSASRLALLFRNSHLMLLIETTGELRRVRDSLLQSSY